MATPYLIGLQNQRQSNDTFLAAGLSDSSSATQDLKQPLKIPLHVSDILRKKGLDVDGYGVVTWTGYSPMHPRRWPLLRKLYDTAVICFLEFFVTVISNTGSSMAPLAAQELGISREMALFCFTTLYLVGQAVGGLVFPPIAESFGGCSIYVSSNLGYAAFCLIIAAWPTLTSVIVGRFVTGLLSAMPCAVAASSIGTMWDMTRRTFVVHVWICGAISGLALGPSVGTFVSLSPLGWRFVFTIAAATTAISTLLCLGMEQSRPSEALRRQVKDVARMTGFDGLAVGADNSLPSLRAFLRSSLILPLRLFFTEPIVLLTSTMAATVVSLIYLFSASLDIIYVDQYGFGAERASLVLLAIAVGIVFTFLPRLYDLHITRLRRRHHAVLEPEDKLFGFYVAAPVLAAGLWWFALSVPPLRAGTSPWVSIASLLLLGFSIVEFDAVLSGYLCDTYAVYAASANASLAFLRAILSGTLPLFGRQVFSTLGLNNALFMLAGIATAFCGVAVLFRLHGKKIRERSPFAGQTWTTSLVGSGMSSEETSGK